MFKKLLSNLPFNPGLINQVSFYVSRVRREEKLRRLGVGLVALAMFVQIFAVISPPQPSLAASPNDIVYGGFSSASQLAGIYDRGCDGANRCDIKNIFKYFGISKSSQIRAGKMVTIGKVDQYNTYGRSVSSKGYIRKINANGTTIYERNLGVWSPKSWKALEVINDKGHKVWILTSCGNPTTKPQGDPKIDIEKLSTPKSGQKVKRGEEITYRLLYRNSGNNVARNFNIKDSIPSQVEFVRWGNFGANKTRSGRNLTFFNGDKISNSTLAVSSSDRQVNFVVRVKDNAKAGRFCNFATIYALGQKDKKSNQVCHEIVDPCPYNPNLPKDSPNCKPPQPPPPPDPDPCPYNPNLPKDSPDCVAPQAFCEDLSATFLSRNRVRFSLTASRLGSATVNQFRLALGDGNTVDVASGSPQQNVYTASYTHTYPEQGPRDYVARLTVLSSVGNKTSNDCAENITVEEPLQPKVVVDKRVSNNTQDKEDAHGSIAKPGDELTYTITAENVGDGSESAFIFPEDDITNIIDYAELIDAGDASVVESEGITKLVWENPVEIKAGQSVSKQFTVRIKQTLPQTNTPESDPDKFDCQITNTISGENSSDDTVIVKFDFTLCKPVEQVLENLPKTGPGSSMILVFLLTTSTAYFFARTRLMRRELEIIRNDYSHKPHGGHHG